MHDAGEKRLTHLGHEGLAKMALSMFDMALYDALAREAGVPLYKLLGGKAEPLPTYNSCGLGLMEPADAAREASELVAEHGGFSHVKLRMGREHATQDIAAYRAVREAIGPDVVISVDFNQGLTAATALDTCRAIDGLGLAWIEEPVAYDDYDTQARLATSSPRPSRSARTGGAGASARRPSRWAPATPSCRTCCASAASPAGCGSPASPRRAPCRSPRTCRLTSPPTCWPPRRPPLAGVHGLGPGPAGRPLLPVKGFTTPRDTPGAGLEWNEKAIAACRV